MNVKKIVYLTADWCSACKAMKPIFEKEVIKLNIDYEYVDIDSDYGVELCSKYNIKNIPTLLFFNDKEDLIGKEVGNLASNNIKNYTK